MAILKGANIIDELTNEFLSGNTEEITDIISFCEAPWGLGFKFFPAQKFLLKAFYNIPLETKEKIIHVPDVCNEKILYKMDEQEFLEYLYDEGMCNTKVVEGKQFTELILPIGRRGGKCATLCDTIDTTIGTITFEELLNRKNNNETIGILTYDPETLKQHITYNFSIWDNGERECSEIVTKKGITETSSQNHPYLVWKEDNEKPEFIQLDKLQVGQRIAISKKSALFGQGGIGVNKAKLLGYLTGDGGTTVGIYFTSASDKIVNEIREILEVDFIKCHIHPLTAKYQYYIARKKKSIDKKNQLKDWLISVGCFGKKAIHKEIPECIWKATKEETAAFISRLFACDGWAAVESKAHDGRKHTKGHIGYCSSSKKLIEGVHSLLIKFGIHANYRSKIAKFKGKEFQTYCLEISSKNDILTFANEIGIYSKEENVQRVVDSVKDLDTYNRELDSLPKGIWNRIEKTRKEKNMNYRQVVGGETYDAHRLRRQYAPNRVKVAEYGKNLDDKFIQYMAESDVLWDEIKSITPVGKKRTVDLNVEETHIIGRHIISHNSTIASCISCYELYKLVKRGDPSKYYAYPPETNICVTCVAPTDDQAGTVFDMIQSKALACQYLRGRNVNQTLTYFNVQTDEDKKYPSKKQRASLTVMTGGCASNSLRGKNNIMVIFDEMAFFIDNGGRFSSGEVYKALKPSTATFKGDGKIICISSPYAKYGMFWDLYQNSFNNQESVLMIQLPTAYINPAVQSNFLRAEKKRDKLGFTTEYAAKFADKVSAWVDDENQFKSCISSKPSISRGEHGIDYFMGVDLGLKNDGTAISISHRDYNTKKIIVDHVTLWFSGSSDIWDVDRSIYINCTRMKHMEIIQVADVANEIAELCKWFPIKSGWFDQFNGYALLQMLNEKGLKQFRMESITANMNTEMYQLWKTLYTDQRVEICNDEMLINEIMQLEAERKGGSRGASEVDKEGDIHSGRVMQVRAQNKKGAHDDISFATAISIFEAYNTYVEKGGENRIAGNPQNNSIIVAPSIAAFRMAKGRMHGGITNRTPQGNKIRTRFK